jgi:hypothetical protein
MDAAVVPLRHAGRMAGHGFGWRRPRLIQRKPPWPMLA